MIIGLNIALTIMLVLAFYQDKKFRSIDIFIFAGIALISSLYFHFSDYLIQGLIMNWIFTVIVISGLILCISIREKRPVNIFKAHFGVGDLVFFIVVSPLFANQNFILFFITGIVFSCCMHVLMSQIKRSGETVPLAGYLSLYLIFLKALDMLLIKDLFYSNLI